MGLLMLLVLITHILCQKFKGGVKIMGTKEKHSINGKVRIILEDGKGKVIDKREVKNTIVRSGRELVAKLFCGEATDPIGQVGVGSDGTATKDADTGLKKEISPRVDIGYIAGQTKYTTTEEGSVKVSLSATFDDNNGVGALSEAGIFSKAGVLYNRVTFAVINKAKGHRLTLNWEITF